uniref:hypothetical protein n=1 Tax=Segatella hominis TaxID=2518605 RepID=UPI0040268B86
MTVREFVTIVRQHKKLSFAILVLVLVLGKIVSVSFGMCGIGTFGGERNDILRRRNYLIGKLVTTPQKVMEEMPGGMDEQFQGEWAMYSCSMFAVALTNIARIYPEQKEVSLGYVDKLIEIVMSSEIREYDRKRWWGEDALASLEGDHSHVSYLSILAWMMGEYKELGGGNKYDELYGRICYTLNRRMLDAETLNLPTYPDEPIYVPDMLVAVVALSHYAKLNHGSCQDTVNRWIEKAKTDWLDAKTGLLVSFLDNTGAQQIDGMPVKGAYSALNCYYLSLIDRSFAKGQYERLKQYFYQSSPISGLKEYHDRNCPIGMDADAGPIIANLSPSDTAFMVGSATCFGDADVRRSLIKTAEIAGSTFYGFTENHYLLANFALVGEAVMLAMRTNVEWI